MVNYLSNTSNLYIVLYIPLNNFIYNNVLLYNSICVCVPVCVVQLLRHPLIKVHIKVHHKDLFHFNNYKMFAIKKIKKHYISVQYLIRDREKSYFKRVCNSMKV